MKVFVFFGEGAFFEGSQFEMIAVGRVFGFWFDQLDVEVLDQVVFGDCKRQGEVASA